MFVGRFATSVAPPYAMTVARDTTTDTVNYWHKPLRDVVCVSFFAVHWKRACTKPIYFAFRPLPVHVTRSSFWAGAEISDQIWCKPSHFPLQASLDRVFSHNE